MKAMTTDEFLDEMKKNGNTIYRCTVCNFRAFGRPVFIHELVTRHRMVNEDTLAKEFDDLFQ